MRLEDLERDVRFAVRTLLRAPGVTAAAIATLALGIGLSAAIFSVVRSVVLEQLPFGDPDRLVSVASQSSDPRGRVSMWLANEWRLRARSLHSIAACDDSQLLVKNGGDALTLGATAAVLLAVTFCASLIPAIAAVRVEPTRALRAD